MNIILRIVRYLPLPIFLFHMVATAIYLLPANTSSDLIPKFIRTYMVVLFSQSWHFFAPTPGYFTDKLWAECGYSGNRLEWHDPVAPVLMSAARYPFSPSSKLSYLHRIVASNLYDAVASKAKESCPSLGTVRGQASFGLCEKALDLASKTEEYRRALEYARAHCLKKRQEGDQLSGVKLMVVRKLPFPFSRRTEYGKRPYFQVQPIEFKRETISWDMNSSQP